MATGEHVRIVIRGKLIKTAWWKPPIVIDLPIRIEGDECVIVGTRWDGFRFPVGHYGTLSIPERKKKKTDE